MERNLNFQKIYALNEYLKKSKMANVRLLPHLGPLCMGHGLFKGPYDGSLIVDNLNS